MEAWRRGLDCIVVERADLEAFLGLQKFKSARINALLEDLHPWFWIQVPYYLTRAPSSLSSLFLSRVPIKEHLPRGSMSARERVGKMAKDAPSTELLHLGRSSERFTEAEIVTRLARLASGLEAPKRRAS